MKMVTVQATEKTLEPSGGFRDFPNGHATGQELGHIVRTHVEYSTLVTPSPL